MRFKLAGFLPVSAASVLLFLTTSLGAYQPGKWYHTDPYVVTARKGGPLFAEVYDPTGQLLKKATYAYSQDGHILKETYFNSRGTQEGETSFEYDSKGQPLQEVLYDPRGNILSKRLYSYSDNRLASTKAIDEKGGVILEQDYYYHGQKISGGVEKAGEDSLQFLFKYQGDKLIMVTVLNIDGSPLSQVKYSYNSKGQLTSREKNHLGEKSLCRYDYSNGKLIAYTYFNQGEHGWSTEKSIRLHYQ